VILFFSGEK